MNTQEFLNQVTYPLGSNIRRKYMQYFDTITFSTNKVIYPLFSTDLGDESSRNKKLPLSGSQVFGLMNIESYINASIGVVSANYESLIDMLQQSYLEIIINSKQQIKLPAIEFVNFDSKNIVGGIVLNGISSTTEIKRKKNLIIPIFFNSTTEININFVTTLTTASSFNLKNMRFTLSGIQSDKLDSIFINPVQGNFQELAYTMYDTVSVNANANHTYELFKDSSKSQNLYSKLLNLSSAERFEVQNIEIFQGCKINVTADFAVLKAEFNKMLLKVKINDVSLYESSLTDFISMSSRYDMLIDTNTTVTTDRMTFTQYNFLFQNKSLAIPLLFPANGQVSVTLEQFGNSNNPNSFIVLLKGKLTRGVN